MNFLSTLLIVFGAVSLLVFILCWIQYVSISNEKIRQQEYANRLLEHIMFANIQPENGKFDHILKCQDICQKLQNDIWPPDPYHNEYTHNETRNEDCEERI